MPTVTESVGRPANPDIGDIWIRIGGTSRIPYQYSGEPTVGLGGWLGFPAAGGTFGLHLAKRTAQDFDSIWVEPIAGMVAVRHVPTDNDEWQLNHGLLSPFVDVTAIRAANDWVWNPGNQTWADPHAATRPVTLLHGEITFTNDNFVTLKFTEAVRGVALIRR